MSRRLPAYADLVALPEAERIDLMGKVAQSGKSVGFFVEDEENGVKGAKGDRYLEALRKRYRIRVITRKPAPVPGAEFISIGPAAPFN